MKMKVEDARPNIGSIIHVDRSALLEGDVIHRCAELLEERGVLVFPQIGLTDDEQLAFTDSFGGRVNFTKTVAGGGDASDIYTISLDPKQNPEPEYVLGTFFWHIDGVTIDQPLPKGTLLTARKLSSTGGQTEFASTYAAYENLPEADKATYGQLKVVHKMETSMRPVFEVMSEEDLARWRGMSSVMTHPLVWTHNAGRKSLVVGSHADSVVGLPIAHGRSLLVRLQEWAAQPAFSYRHEWQEGDLVIWDNYGLMHRVVPYDVDSGRMMHRTTLKGEERVAA